MVERGLKDACWEHDLVLGWSIVSINLRKEQCLTRIFCETNAIWNRRLDWRIRREAVMFLQRKRRASASSVGGACRGGALEVTYLDRAHFPFSSFRSRNQLLHGSSQHPLRNLDIILKVCVVLQLETIIFCIQLLRVKQEIRESDHVGHVIRLICRKCYCGERQCSCRWLVIGDN